MKMAFWVTYDHLGKLMLANMIWVTALIIPATMLWAAVNSQASAVLSTLLGVLALITLILALPVSTAGLAHMVKEFIETRDGSVRTMLSGMRIYWKRAASLGFIFSAIFALLGTSVWFYATRLHDTLPWLGYGLSAFSLWCLLFVVLCSVLAIPTLVQKKESVRVTLKLSALLVAHNPFFVFGLALNLLCVMIVVPPLVFLLSGAVGVVLVSSAYEMLSRKYDRIAQADRGAENIDDEKTDDYLSRGLRDFLFPWKN